MTNLINISFAALLVTNVVQSVAYKFKEGEVRYHDFERTKAITDHYTITSNYVSHVAIDGKTNTITLDCVTNNQWTVETKLEWVSKTNGTPPLPEEGQFIYSNDKWWRTLPGVKIIYPTNYNQ